MNQPLFSIIIPTRERHQTLPYAIQSVLNSTYNNYELIIMDNFSSEETYQVVHEFKDHRIKYYRAPERLSMGDNWELALSKTTGDYVFVLGDDDALMPDALDLASEMINHYQISIISWLRYIYGWDSVIVPFLKNRLLIQTSQEVLLFNSQDILTQYYSSAISHEYLPMIYNSFVKKELIQHIKSFHNRYFHTHCPDIGSGILNAYFSDNYIFSLRALSLTGVSGYSNGASSLFQTANKDQAMNHYLRDENKNTNELYHPNFRLEDDSIEIPLITEISIIDAGLWIKDLFFPDDNNFKVDFQAILQLAANQINRNKHLYEITKQYLLLLAKKHGISNLQIPKKQNSENIVSSEPMREGFYLNGNEKLNKIVVNCEQIGILNVADAAKLAQGILPNISALRVENQLILDPLNLNEINYIIFPNWETDEEDLMLGLNNIIKGLMVNNSDQKVTLLIDINNFNEEDAELLVSGVAMNLMLEEEIDISEALEISFVKELSENQWSQLLPKINARIATEFDNKERINQVKADSLLTLNAF